MSKRRNGEKTSSNDGIPEFDPFGADDVFGQELDISDGCEAMDGSDARKNYVLKDVKYVGNMEKDSKAEMAELHKTYRDMNHNINQMRTETLDSEYWLCVCFQNREQK